MKTHLLIIVALTCFVSCKKEMSLAPNENQPEQYVDERIGQLLKFNCAGGDTAFADTLVLKLESVSRSPTNNDEIFYYSFSYPIWHYYYYECNGQDLLQLSSLNFTSPECKSVYFKLVK